MQVSKSKVLVVEDLAEWRRTLKRVLEREGYEPEFTDNYPKAVSLLEKRTYDVVIIDIRLKDWDKENIEGMLLLSKLGPESHTKVIMLTAYGDVEMARKAFKEHKVFDFMSKREEFDPDELINVVRKAIKERTRELYGST